MHSMNDERFFDLAMKVIAGQSSDAERAELDALLARQPELRAEFARLQAEAPVAKEALLLVQATEATAGQLPGYARGRLRTKVQQTLLARQAGESRDDARQALAWGWRWWLGLAVGAAAVMVLLLGPLSSGQNVVVQLAVLDLAGAMRGGETNDMAALAETWNGVRIEGFSEAERLAAWREDWSAKGKEVVVKVIYDRSAGEVRVAGRGRGLVFATSFPAEPDLRTALAKARAYIAAQVGK